jgi:sporulation protein YlmC with PRC-barrel domain
MSKKLSALYGLDIYSTSGSYIGKVEDILLNLEEGVVMSIYLKPLNGVAVDSTELKRIIKEEGVSYDGVSSVGDIILTKSKPFKDVHKMKHKKVIENDELDSDSISMG